MSVISQSRINQMNGFEINQIPEDVHKSEWAWANIQMSAILANDGSLEDLKSLVKDLLAST